MVIVENGTMLHIETSRHLATARLIMNYVIYYVIVGIPYRLGCDVLDVEAHAAK